MPPVKPKRNYNCTQNELYHISRIAWRNCKEHLPEFASFKTFYSLAHINSALQSIASAADLPDEMQRDSLERRSHQELVCAGEECISKWRLLRSYISVAFPSGYEKMHIKAAGNSSYKFAQNKNWVHLSAMMSESENFIIKNHAKLLNAGMPVDFQSEFSNASITFSQLFLKYKDEQ